MSNDLKTTIETVDLLASCYLRSRNELEGNLDSIQKGLGRLAGCSNVVFGWRYFTVGIQN